MFFILQKTNQSLQVCLDDFFDFHELQSVSKSACTQARANLCPKVFKRLNLLIVRLFYASTKIKRWKGFRVLGVDGSTLQLPDNHPSLKPWFSSHCFGPKKDAGHWMSRISYLYDVFNGLVIDAQMGSYTSSESVLCRQHLPFVQKGDLLLFGRYYASCEWMFLLTAKSCHFVFRMKDNWWKCVDQFVKTGLKEQEVCLRLPKKSHHLLKKYPHLNKDLKVRLIRKVGGEGKVQVYCTSLIDTQIYTHRAITNLYKQRWGIEEVYKLIKARLEVADFSGKTAWAIQQDFYAKSMLISLCNALCFDLKPKKTKKPSAKRKSKERTPVINRTYALHHLREILKKITLSAEKLNDWIKTYLKRVEEFVEYSRKSQANQRKIKPLSKYSMNYKHA